jgi:hypothetical protein
LSRLPPSAVRLEHENTLSGLNIFTIGHVALTEADSPFAGWVVDGIRPLELCFCSSNPEAPPEGVFSYGQFGTVFARRTPHLLRKDIGCFNSLNAHVDSQPRILEVVLDCLATNREGQAG